MFSESKWQFYPNEVITYKGIEYCYNQYNSKYIILTITILTNKNTLIIKYPKLHINGKKKRKHWTVLVEDKNNKPHPRVKSKSKYFNNEQLNSGTSSFVSIVNPSKKKRTITIENFVDRITEEEEQGKLEFIYEDSVELFVELVKFRNKNSPYNNAISWVHLFHHYGGNSKLQHMSIKVLSITTSSAAVERNFSTFGFIYSKIRNRLHKELFVELVKFRNKNSSYIMMEIQHMAITTSSAAQNLHNNREKLVYIFANLKINDSKRLNKLNNINNDDRINNENNKDIEEDIDTDNEINGENNFNNNILQDFDIISENIDLL
ncbi:hypothetical protein Glove_144g116 [Diversispora epigaea]|uniref:HAT C-terminal dimerisation domain-containing protein n=1 Tax=Diversispora epigaea TaxID=1348612 RepID=A0A397J3Q1_9GLOM|nr:hypothetical protein Glove_144g116 [Diversispora epigaea]